MAGGAGDDDGPGHEVAAGHFVEQPAGVRGDGAAEVGMQKIVAEESGGNAAKLDGHAVDGVRMAAAAKEGGEGVAHLVPGIGRTRGCEACLPSIFFSLLHSMAHLPMVMGSDENGSTNIADIIFVFIFFFVRI